MSRPTKAPPFPPRDLAEAGPCGCGCGRTAPARRRWFGPGCQKAWLLTWDWSSMRRHVIERDGYDCRRCGIDTRLVRKACSGFWRMGGVDVWVQRRAEINRWEAQEQVRTLLLERLEKHARRSRSFWRVHPGRETRGYEIDHIVPLAEGGPHHVDNLRVLCPRCHRAETAALAARRAKARRGVVEPAGPRLFELEAEVGGAS